MWSNAPTIAAGDLVIVWQTRDAITPLVMEPGKELQLRFGVFRHVDIIGLPFGSKIASRNGRGFVHILRPTPELWTLALPHRTQILYVADIAFITAYLNIRPGSRVVEAGTGSGSFSHSLARTVAPTGHLYTFEFHAQRAEKARGEFALHDMLDVVTPAHRNVCKDGFGLSNVADSVFLDLPAPWDAVSHAYEAMRKDRLSRICCFSPCIEQVLRTISALNDAGFSDIVLFEVLLTPQEVSPVPTLLPISHAIARLQDAEIRREERRQKQIAKAARERAIRAGESTTTKRSHDETGTPPEPEPAAKRARVDNDAEEELQDPALLNSLAAEQPDVSLMKPMHEVRGHTSYLTFACIRPQINRSLKISS